MYRLLNSRTFLETIIALYLAITYWMWQYQFLRPMLPFHTPRKLQETSGFLMFSGGIKRDQCMKWAINSSTNTCYFKSYYFKNLLHRILPSTVKYKFCCKFFYVYHNLISPEKNWWTDLWNCKACRLVWRRDLTVTLKVIFSKNTLTYAMFQFRQLRKNNSK